MGPHDESLARAEVLVLMTCQNPHEIVPLPGSRILEGILPASKLSNMKQAKTMSAFVSHGIAKQVRLTAWITKFESHNHARKGTCGSQGERNGSCLLYTSDAADE